MIRSNRRRLFASVVTVAACLGALAVAETTASQPAAASSASSASSAETTFVVDTGRLLDTRSIGGPYSAGSWHAIVPNGRLGLPTTNLSALAVTLTVVGPQAAGFASVGQAGQQGAPSTSSIDWNPGQTISNSALVATDDAGTFAVYVSSSVNLIVDVQGYYAKSAQSTNPGAFVPIPNGGIRVVDTRTSGVPNGSTSPGSLTTVGTQRLNGVPAGDVAILADITVVPHRSGSGYLTVWAEGSPQPNTSLNFLAGHATSLTSVIGVDSQGQFQLLDTSSSTIDFIVDVLGYYTGATASQTLTPLNVRVADTRRTARLVPGSVTPLETAGSYGVPPAGRALAFEIVTITVINRDPRSSGYLRVWGSRQAEPSTSQLNFAGAGSRSNQTSVVPGGDDQAVDVRYVGGPSPVDVVIDVQGWYTNSSSATPPGPPQSVTATALNGGANISFTAPSSDGGAPITSYTIIATPNSQTATAGGGPISLFGLHNFTHYEFIVLATNAAGTGPPSDVSNDVVPHP